MKLEEALSLARKGRQIRFADGPWLTPGGLESFSLTKLTADSWEVSEPTRQELIEACEYLADTWCELIERHKGMGNALHASVLRDCVLQLREVLQRETTI